MKVDILVLHLKRKPFSIVIIYYRFHLFSEAFSAGHREKALERLREERLSGEPGELPVSIEQI